MDDKKISVVINTYNAEQHLDRVLEAASGFDEVVVCDMESTDHTLEIARRHGCRVVNFPRGEYNIVEPAREFAIHQASHPWVLVVDADEIVPNQLREHLYRLIAKDDCPDGLFIPRKNFFMGHFMHSHYPDYILRFFRRDLTHWPAVIHCSPEVNGRVEKLPKSDGKLAFVHLANDTVSDIVGKTNQYTLNELVRRKDRQYATGALLWRPFFRFFKTYIMKGGIYDGVPGLIKAILDGFYQFVFLAKKYEQKKSKSHE